MVANLAGGGTRQVEVMSMLGRVTRFPGMVMVEEGGDEVVVVVAGVAIVAVVVVVVDRVGAWRQGKKEASIIIAK